MHEQKSACYSILQNFDFLASSFLFFSSSTLAVCVGEPITIFSLSIILTCFTVLVSFPFFSLRSFILCTEIGSSSDSLSSSSSSLLFTLTSASLSLFLELQIKFFCTYVFIWNKWINGILFILKNYYLILLSYPYCLIPYI